MTALLLLLVPLTGGAAVYVLRERLSALAWLPTAIMLMTLGLGVIAAIGGSGVSWTWGSGLRLHLAAEGFARVMVVVVPLVAATVVTYISTGEDLPPVQSARLLASICAFVAAMELLVLAGDLLTLLIGWELVGALSWLLIGFEWRDGDRPRSATVAFLTTRFGDLGLYVAAAAAMAAVGSLEFSALADVGDPLRHVIVGGVLLAAAAKSAQLPFAPWLFSAMAGPTPVSALLHSATLVAAGAFVLVRLAAVTESVGWFAPTVAAIGTLTALLAGLVALLQTDVKRALAASTSSQYGLMFVAIGAGSAAAAGAHLVSHALFKSLLFLGAGVAIHAAGTRELQGMRLGRALPAAAGLFLVGTLALAAVPPLGGAFTKEKILSSAFGASGWMGYALLFSGLVTAAYASRLFLLAYGPGPARPHVRTPGRGEVAGVGALAAMSVVLGLLWLPGGEGVVERLAGGELEGGEVWQLSASLLGIAFAGGGTLWAWRRGKLATVGLDELVRARLADWLGIPTLARVAIVRPVILGSAALARLDDHVVDAGVRAATRIGSLLSRALSRAAERGIDGVVEGLTSATTQLAGYSRVVDDGAVDGTVEGIATWTGRAGSASRRLQTGMTHHYYVIAGVGLLAMLGISILWR